MTSYDHNLWPSSAVSDEIPGSGVVNSVQWYRKQYGDACPSPDVLSTFSFLSFREIVPSVEYISNASSYDVTWTPFDDVITSSEFTTSYPSPPAAQDFQKLQQHQLQIGWCPNPAASWPTSWNCPGPEIEDDNRATATTTGFMSQFVTSYPSPTAVATAVFPDGYYQPQLEPIGSMFSWQPVPEIVTDDDDSATPSVDFLSDTSNDFFDCCHMSRLSSASSTASADQSRSSMSVDTVDDDDINDMLCILKKEAGVY
jgi:hypothetical protein